MVSRHPAQDTAGAALFLFGGGWWAEFFNTFGATIHSRSRVLIPALTRAASMFRRISLLLLAVALSGCAAQTAQMRPPPSVYVVARDGLGEDRTRSRRTRAERRNDAVTSNPADSEREKVLATLRPHSAAWWTVHDAIESDQEKQLSKKLVICRGCYVPSNAEDQTGSVAPQ